MTKLTAEQTAEVARLENAGLAKKQAVALATQVDLDVPLGADGQPLVPPVSYERISPPEPLLP